jgi:predicted transposase/invertase (TIGR01784 family)
MDRLNPLNDYIFKRLMEETDHLIAFLNAVLDAKDQQRLISAEMIYDKASRLDVWAKTADGMQLNIEVQLTNQNNMDCPSLFAWRTKISKATPCTAG